jgi:hypothetical protein
VLLFPNPDKFSVSIRQFNNTEIGNHNFLQKRSCAVYRDDDDGLCCTTTQKIKEMAVVGAIERNALGFQRLLGDALGITGIKTTTHTAQMPLLLLSRAVTYDNSARLFASTLTRNLYR